MSGQGWDRNEWAVSQVRIGHRLVGSLFIIHKLGDFSRLSYLMLLILFLFVKQRWMVELASRGTLLPGLN